MKRHHRSKLRRRYGRAISPAALKALLSVGGKLGKVGARLGKGLKSVSALEVTAVPLIQGEEWARKKLAKKKRKRS